ncbi:MAG: aminodeoxychorismate synthase component I, partial [Leptospira sp.]|nr:aminodeoxychorismate synthase component I [Leptospira sp.]
MIWEEKLNYALPKSTELPYFVMGVFQNAEESITDFQNKNTPHSAENIHWSLDKLKYSKKIEKIKSYLQNGDCYQINLTFPMSFDWEGSSIELYEYLLSRQKVKYSAYLDLGDTKLISLSPELFLEVSNNKVLTRPMKGTANRSPFLSEDIKIAQALKSSEKNRAENLMIVDLLRNDLGKISQMGSVKTKNLFQIETYQTIHQMTSEVESEISPDKSIWELMENLFPCGSITGAPKIRAMEIIHELEENPRSFYTGSIGYTPPISSKRASIWNIAIRTIQYKDKKCNMSIGSGIVLDSDPDDEYEECKNKARFLTEKVDLPRDFHIFESLLWTGKTFRLLNYHLQRMEESATYFQIPFNKDKFLESLQSAIEEKVENAKIINQYTQYRVRIQLHENGEFRTITREFTGMSPSNELKSLVRISNEKVKSSDIYLYHKTSFRTLYDSEYS